MNIPRYLFSFTDEMTVPADSDTGRHEALFLSPIRKQHDLRVLTTISSLSSSNSQVLTKASRPQTEGAISRMSSAYRNAQTYNLFRDLNSERSAVDDLKLPPVISSVMAPFSRPRCPANRRNR